MSRTYTPARACLVVSDNGEERLIDCPEIQELLDELHEVRRDASLAIEAKDRLIFQLQVALHRGPRSQHVATTALWIGWLAAFLMTIVALIGWARVWGW